MLEDISVYLIETGAPIYKYTETEAYLNEALWSYLLPWLERLKVATGEEIDLYGVANFVDEGLEMLKQHFQQAIDYLQTQDTTVFVVDLGEESGPNGSKRILYDLQRDQACKDLKQIIEMAEQAEIKKMTLRFKGL